MQLIKRKMVIQINRNSYICRFISEHENWRELLDEMGIGIKEEYPFAIFNYTIGCDFSSPIVQEARGIIIDLENLDVACWPFRKFGNYNESYADKIDWATARVQEKVDGSIVKLWWNRMRGAWQFSTNSMIDAHNATANALSQKSFLDLIKEADNYDAIQKTDLSKEYTYIFELVSPETQVVVKYPQTLLFLIGVRNNITGKEEKTLGYDICIPREYKLQSLDDCIRAAQILNKPFGKVNRVTQEGFVVVDDQWNRIKIKSPEYLMLHNMSSNQNFSKERLVGLIREEAINIQDMSRDFPNYSHYFKYYDFKVAELNYQVKIFCDLTDRIYEEYSRERKAVANVIKSHRLAPIGFMHLDSEKSGSEILDSLPLKKFCKYIPDYRPEKLADLFYPK